MPTSPTYTSSPGRSEAWRLEDEKVAAGGFAISEGVGARTIEGEQTAFAYSSEMTARAIGTATEAIRSMRQQGYDADRRAGVRLDTRPAHALYSAADPALGMGAAEKIRLLREVDRRARSADPRVIYVSANLQASHTVVLVAGSDGRLVADLRPQVQLSLSVIADDGRRRATGSANAGGRFALKDLQGERLDRLIDTATRIALVNLDARPAPAGVMTVVLGPGFPGVLLHEAVGHGLEGDAHRKRASVFTGRMLEQIAAPGVTVIDDGTLPERRGSLNVDDEGAPTSRTVLIENGRLTCLMQDRLNASLMNQATTGNGRRQSYAHLPMPRMTNTFLAPGPYAADEILASVKQGIYAVDFGGGTVDITSGQFNFSATEAYLIEDGRITAPIEGATLIGLGHEALKQVSMVGDNLALANGVCGKEGQNVSVCVGQPTVRIDEMVVGGTS